MNSARQNKQDDPHQNLEFEDIEKPETSRSVQIPPWMVQDKVSFWEKVEIRLF